MYVGLKILVGSVVLLLLSLGLCGIAHGTSLSTIGFYGFLLSVLGLFVGLVVTVVEVIIRAYRKDQ